MPMRALILSLLLFVTTPLQETVVMAQSKDDVPARNKALVEDRFNAWRNGTGNPFELLADEASWTIVGRSAASKTYSSKEEFLREVIRPFNARMKEGLKPAIRNIYADGNTVIIFFDAAGIARDGKPYTNTYAWFLEMRDGKVVKASAFYDSIEFNDLWTRVAP
jgi:ketosteroid isomerase-like protein